MRERADVSTLQRQAWKGWKGLKGLKGWNQPAQAAPLLASAGHDDIILPEWMGEN